jgi:hypothetical protein
MPHCVRRTWQSGTLRLSGEITLGMAERTRARAKPRCVKGCLQRI